MTELRKSVVDSIYEAVSSTYFGADNYEVTFPESGSPLVKIVFLAQPNYIFTIYDDYRNEGRVSTNESPGAFKLNDEYTDLGITSISNRIDAWAGRIRKELSSIGVRKPDTDEIFEKIDEYVQSLESPNDTFSGSEIDELKTKLHDLENRFEELLEKSQITESELNSLKAQIRGAEQDLPVFSKAIWYKTSMRKVVGTTKSILTSKEGREVALGLMKKLIGLE